MTYSLIFIEREFRWDKRYRGLSSLPQRSSWGSGRWMCTWKTKRRQTPPTMHRYIAASVQQRDSNISMNWGWLTMERGSSLGLLRTSSGGCWRRRLNNLLGEWAEQRQDGLVAGWPKLAEGENKSGDTAKFESRRDLAMETPREGFPFYSST
jgi:hypothetical protein